MKKIMGIFAAMALMIVGLFAITAAPASAAGCGANQTGTTSDYYYYGDGVWLFKPSVTFQRCTTSIGDPYAKVNAYSVNIQRVSDGCGGGTFPTLGHHINGWRVNPDVLGPWNAATKENFACQGNFVFSPGGAVVWGSSPYDNRCISGDITPKINAWPDGDPEAIPLLCVI